MRFGLSVVLMIAAGAGIGWALPGGSKSAGKAEAAATGGAASHNELASAEQSASPGNVSLGSVYVSVPVHFAYAAVLVSLREHELSKSYDPKEVEVKSVTDRSATMSGHQGDERVEVTFTFKQEGSGTRISMEANGTGALADKMKEDAADPARGSAELARLPRKIEQAAAEFAREKPEWTLNRAADEILESFERNRYEAAQARAGRESDDPPAENAATEIPAVG